MKSVLFVASLLALSSVVSGAPLGAPVDPDFAGITYAQPGYVFPSGFPYRGFDLIIYEFTPAAYAEQTLSFPQLPVDAAFSLLLDSHPSEWITTGYSPEQIYRTETSWPDTPEEETTTKNAIDAGEPPTVRIMLVALSCGWIFTRNRRKARELRHRFRRRVRTERRRLAW